MSRFHWDVSDLVSHIAAGDETTPLWDAVVEINPVGDELLIEGIEITDQDGNAVTDIPQCTHKEIGERINDQYYEICRYIQQTYADWRAEDRARDRESRWD
jgi:hypothetical protein